VKEDGFKRWSISELAQAFIAVDQAKGQKAERERLGIHTLFDSAASGAFALTMDNHKSACGVTSAGALPLST
ncbi:hypothetical protein HAX54_029822, partial [Datura stramonium]|nr:hypothetical protein [Datura stramonium]